MKIIIIIITLLLIGSKSYAQIEQNEKNDKENYLTEVVVFGDSIFHYSNKDIYRITKSMRKGTYSTAQLLGKVPGISYNYANNSLAYLGDKNIIILVDSIEKNVDYIKGLHHIRFDKVEVIPNPTGKYSSYIAIINLHTRPNYEGYENNLTTGTSLYPSDNNGKSKNFGQNEWIESFTYTKNKWNFMLFYSGDYNVGERNTYYQRTFLNNDYKETVVANEDGSHNQGFTERENTLGTSVDYQINKRNSISIVYGLELTNNDDFSNKTVIGTTLSDNNKHYFNLNSTNKDKGNRHGFGLYYRGGTGVWNYNATLNYIKRTWDTNNFLSRSSGYNYEDDRHQKMDHLYADLNLNRHFLNNRMYFSASYNYFWKKYNQYKLSNNALLSKNTLIYNYLSAYLSYELPNKTNIYVSGDIRRYKSIASNSNDEYFAYSGSAGLYKRISNYGWLRLDYVCNLTNPSLNQTSPYEYNTDSLTKYVGNPLLRTSLRHNISLKLNFFDCLTLQTGMSYYPRSFSCIRSSVNRVLSNGEQENYIISTYQNGNKHNWWSALNFNSDLMNFNIDANIRYNYIKSKYDIFRHTNCGWSGNMQIGYMWYKKKIFTAMNYTFNNDYEAEVQSWNTNYNDHFNATIIKYLCHDNLQLKLSYSLPFSFSSLISYSNIEAPGYKLYSTQDNKRIIHNVICFSISYRIFGGKSVRKYQPEMSEER